MSERVCINLHKASSSVALPVKEMGEPNLDLSMRLAQQSQLRLLEVNNRGSKRRDLLGSGSLYCHFPWFIAKQIQSVLGENKGMSQSSPLRLL